MRTRIGKKKKKTKNINEKKIISALMPGGGKRGGRLKVEPHP